MNETYLAHWRTPGSKNGVRLYQYKDGTYTELGKERRRKGDSRGEQEEAFDTSLKEAERKLNYVLADMDNDGFVTLMNTKMSDVNDEAKNVNADSWRMSMDSTMSDAEKEINRLIKDTPERKSQESSNNEKPKQESQKKDKPKQESKKDKPEQDGESQKQETKKKDQSNNAQQGQSNKKNNATDMFTVFKKGNEAYDSINKILKVRSQNAKIDELNAKIATMTTEELQTFVTRSNWEKKYKEAIAYKASEKGKIAVSDILNALQNTAEFVSTFRDLWKET